MISLALSCPAFGQDISGSCRNKTFGLLDQGLLFLNNMATAHGCSLELKKDFTYTYRTCGNIETGTWERRGDSLLLFCQSNRYRVDSLNQSGWQGKFAGCSNKPDVFIIDQALLKQTQTFKNGAGTMKALNYLTKTGS